MSNFYRSAGNLQVLIDEGASDTYIGKAPFGQATSASAWQILKISVSGTVTSIVWADKNDTFDNIWDNRTSLTYG